jgi:predicted DNA-binding transcriptional regulator YafY
VRGLKMRRSTYPDLPMSQMERIYKLDRLFRRRKPPGKREILEVFEISPAQFKRDLDYMRNRLGAPVTFDMEAGGYKYTAEEFNLPGLWFTELEVYSLLLMHSLLDQLQPGLVREQLGPFRDKLRALLGKPVRGTQSILERMEVSAAPQRPIDPEHFQAISDATLRRKKLRMRYYSRSRGVASDRVVSPQRVIYYRGNWYLDAWCHEKEAMRRFAIDAVRLVSVLEEPALEVAASGQQGYGIFSGPAEYTAVLVFDAVASRWVSEEEWHPLQRASALPDGGLQLEVPYSNPQEILMDILRHGPHVEVVSPASLRSAVAETHREAAEKYALQKRSVDSVRSTTGSQTARAR